MSMEPFARKKLYWSDDVVHAIGWDLKLVVHCPSSKHNRRRMRLVSKPKAEPRIYYCSACNETWELQ